MILVPRLGSRLEISVASVRKVAADRVECPLGKLAE